MFIILNVLLTMVIQGINEKVKGNADRSYASSTFTPAGEYSNPRGRTCIEPNWTSFISPDTHYSI